MKIYITTNNEKLSQIFEDELLKIDEIDRDEFINSLPIRGIVNTAVEKHFGEDLIDIDFDMVSDFSKWTSMQTNPTSTKWRARVPLFMTDDFDQSDAYAIMTEVAKQVQALAEESAV